VEGSKYVICFLSKQQKAGIGILTQFPVCRNFPSKS